MRVIAIIPARSGSEGLKNKNMRTIAGRSLIERAIDFAHTTVVEEIFVSTDSKEYFDIAIAAGARVLGLRSLAASTSTAMEPAVIDDLNLQFEAFAVDKPDVALWIRPTFVFRSLEATLRCIKMVTSGERSAGRVVTEVDPRLYREVSGSLQPNFEDGGASMIRRQGLTPLYHVFNIDVFHWPLSPCPDNYLGSNLGFAIAPKICGVDIDTEEDLKIAEALMQRFGNGIIN